MAPWNEGADRSLGRSPTIGPLARGIPQRSNSRGSVQRTPQCEHLRYLRPALNLRYGAISRLIYLGETNGLESSEDCRSTGGHGNQHVRLRSAQIDRIAAICPAPQAIRLLRAVAGVRRPGCRDGRVYSDWVTVCEGLGTHIGSYQPASSEAAYLVRPRSDVLGIKKVELRTPVRKAGKIAGCGLSLGRCQSDVNGIKRIKI